MVSANIKISFCDDRQGECYIAEVFELLSLSVFELPRSSMSYFLKTSVS